MLISGLPNGGINNPAINIDTISGRQRDRRCVARRGAQGASGGTAARSAVVARLVVECRSDLPLGPSEIIVLDPQLGVVLLHKIFDLLALFAVCSLSGSVIGTFLNVISSG